MYWINFLHFYQPANIDSYNFNLALDNSYLRLLRLMEENNNLHMTWNLTACLLERLEAERGLDYIDRVKKLLDSGRLELVSSAAYHPLLPLIPAPEVIKQIQENERVLLKYFGSNLKLNGFFMPEMAYSPEVAKLVKSLGYNWIILDEVSYQEGRERPDFNSIYQDKNSDLLVIFRDRQLSHSYPPDKLKEFLDCQEFPISNIITATDAELYGLRHRDQSAELEKFVKMKDLKTTTISNFILAKEKQGAEVIKTSLTPSSWESSPADLKAGVYFKLWYDKNNKIHRAFWELSHLALSLEDEFSDDQSYYWYRWHLVRGIASCNFWWASAYDFSQVFGPYAWNPDMIERGLEDLIRAIRSLESSKSKKYKLQAEKIYLKIKKLIWQEHWQKHWH